jgi:hypothetical protein
VRTTLTLEDDVVTELERLQRARREPFKRTVNEVLRAGIAALRAGRNPQRAGGPFRTETASLGTPRLKTLDDVSEVLAYGEGEDHR